ncbi:MAG: response regulator transcription factor [Alphaproteobacteria bacterium]|nr:response regulator transcription factor [Alphaproteobacteria bacterium]
MNAQAHILVVDDEAQIQRFLGHALTASGYTVAAALDGKAALKLFASGGFDLAIVDLGLPGIDGLTVIGQIRQTSDLPIIVLSANDTEDRKIEALDMGADDFVGKPFGIGELLARVRACLRKRPGNAAAQERLEVGGIALDLAAHKAMRDGETLRLTPKEFELLALLMANADRVMTHRQILERIWGKAHVEDVAYLRVFVGQLRQKIEAIPAEPKRIVTEPGIGYRFMAA